MGRSLDWHKQNAAATGSLVAGASTVGVRFKQAHLIYAVGEIAGLHYMAAHKLENQGVAETLTPEQLKAAREARSAPPEQAPGLPQQTTMVQRDEQLVNNTNLQRVSRDWRSATLDDYDPDVPVPADWQDMHHSARTRLARKAFPNIEIPAGAEAAGRVLSIASGRVADDQTVRENPPRDAPNPVAVTSAAMRTPGSAQAGPRPAEGSDIEGRTAPQAAAGNVPGANPDGPTAAPKAGDEGNEGDDKGSEGDE